MQETEQQQQNQQNEQPSNGGSIPVSKGTGGGTVYDMGLKELQYVTSDEGVSRRVEKDFREARGRETARLHVTLKALSESDRRAGDNTRATVDAISRLAAEVQAKTQQLNELVEGFERTAGARFDGVHEDLRTRSETLGAQVRELAANENERFGAMKEQVGNMQQSLWKQAEANFSNLQSQAESNQDQLAAQVRQTTERLAYDVRQTRDELVSLVDNRMNQADASFAALRGDIEVVKFLVMDLIKDRIGRHDPKNKGF